jgi:hypothetical protein
LLAIRIVIPSGAEGSGFFLAVVHCFGLIAGESPAPTRAKTRPKNKHFRYHSFVRSTYELRLPSAPRVRIGGVLARSGVAGVLLGALAFFVSLLLSILTLLVAGMLMGSFKPDMTLAYRVVAPSVAICVLLLGFVANLVWEFRKPERT